MSNSSTDDDARFDIKGQFGELAAASRGGFVFMKPGLSDADVVLTATSVVDEYLKFAIVINFHPKRLNKSLFDKVFKGYGALATFSSKIDLCSALGMFDDDMKNDLTIVRSIRNDFAHSLTPRSLADAHSCKHLRITATTVPESEMGHRAAFMGSCAGIIGRTSFHTVMTLAGQHYLVENQEAFLDYAMAMYREFDPAAECDQ